MSIDTASVGTSPQDDTEDEYFELVHHEVSETEIRNAAAAAKPTALVVVDNLDDGDATQFWVRLNAKIHRVINIAYKNLGLTREDGDRLVSADNQENVFAHEHETVEEYITRHSGAPRLHWLYSGPTGGA